jgi:hypothetical protein
MKQRRAIARASLRFPELSAAQVVADVNLRDQRNIRDFRG